jgi:hypothetical protein
MRGYETEEQQEQYILRIGEMSVVVKTTPPSQTSASTACSV